MCIYGAVDGGIGDNPLRESQNEAVRFFKVSLNRNLRFKFDTENARDSLLHHHTTPSRFDSDQDLDLALVQAYFHNASLQHCGQCYHGGCGGMVPSLFYRKSRTLDQDDLQADRR